MHGQNNGVVRICYTDRGYLFFWSEYQIYFIECVENISIFTSEIDDIFNTWDEIFLVFTEKKK